MLHISTCAYTNMSLLLYQHLPPQALARRPISFQITYIYVLLLFQITYINILLIFISSSRRGQPPYFISYYSYLILFISYYSYPWVTFVLNYLYLNITYMYQVTYISILLIYISTFRLRPLLAAL